MTATIAPWNWVLTKNIRFAPEVCTRSLSIKRLEFCLSQSEIVEIILSQKTILTNRRESLTRWHGGCCLFSFWPLLVIYKFAHLSKLVERSSIAYCTLTIVILSFLGQISAPNKNDGQSKYDDRDKNESFSGPHRWIVGQYSIRPAPATCFFVANNDGLILNRIQIADNLAAANCFLIVIFYWSDQKFMEPVVSDDSGAKWFKIIRPFSKKEKRMILLLDKTSF